MATQKLLQVLLTSRRHGVRESYLSLYIVTDIHVYYITYKYTMSKDRISLQCHLAFNPLTAGATLVH